MTTNLLETIDTNLVFEGNSIRVFGTFDEPLFVVKDICDVLGLTNTTRTLEHVDTEYRHLLQLNSGISTGMQITSLVTEPGLYQIILKCRKPIAQPFQKWICSEVLPSLRKKGEYKMNEEYQAKLTAIEIENRKLEEERDQAETLLLQKDNQIKKLQRLKQVVDGKNVCYLCTTDEKEIEGIYTVGKACNLKNRLSDYNNNKLFNFKIVKYISCKSDKLMDCIERLLLCKLNKYKIISNRDVFQLPEGKDVSHFTQWFDYLSRMCDDIEDNIVLEDRTADEQMMLSLELKEENKEPISILNKEYREKNHEDILDREKLFREENKDFLRERTSDYRFNNRDILNEKQRLKADDEEAKEKKKEYMAVYRKEKVAEIAATRKKYNTDHKEIMEEKIKCACGSTVSRQVMPTHLGTERHQKYLVTGLTVNELRKEDYVNCVCGVSISKRGVKRHETSKLHQAFIASQTSVSS